MLTLASSVPPQAIPTCTSEFPPDAYAVGEGTAATVYTLLARVIIPDALELDHVNETKGKEVVDIHRRNDSLGCKPR